MNKTLGFDEGRLRAAYVDRSAAERRVATLATRHSLKGAAQLAALLWVIQRLDLTTLAGDDTDHRVKRLCASALRPLTGEQLAALRIALQDPEFMVRVAAVCVYPKLVSAARHALSDGSGGMLVHLASVATGFPTGQTPIASRLAEVRQAIADGADEVDVVINRGDFLAGRHREVYDEIARFREACGEHVALKVILGVGNLGPLSNVEKAARLAALAGADTIKTSTGFEPTNATLETALVMARVAREFHDESQGGIKIGLKFAGGIQKAAQALQYVALVLDEMPKEWRTDPSLVRFGASGLLGDVQRQINHFVSDGRYAAAHHNPLV